MAAKVDKLSAPFRAFALHPPLEVQPIPPEPTPEVEYEADYRLVIEEDPAEPGAFIYKTVDRATGRVISQLRREAVVKLRDSPAYQAGAVVKTRA